MAATTLIGLSPRPMLMGAADNAVKRSIRKYHYPCAGLSPDKIALSRPAAKVVVALAVVMAVLAHPAAGSPRLECFPVIGIRLSKDIEKKKHLLLTMRFKGRNRRRKSDIFQISFHAFQSPVDSVTDSTFLYTLGPRNIRLADTEYVMGVYSQALLLRQGIEGGV